MRHNGNGRSLIPEDWNEDNDPEKDFPLKESYQDFANRERNFEITMQDIKLGFVVDAREIGKDDGYYFAAFNGTSPYLALGDLRCRIRRALCVKHLQKRPSGEYSAADDTLRGRISFDRDTNQVAFVVDGILLPLKDFARIVSTFEGFQFSLRFYDRTEEVP